VDIKVIWVLGEEKHFGKSEKDTQADLPCRAKAVWLRAANLQPRRGRPAAHLASFRSRVEALERGFSEHGGDALMQQPL
jgi:hypothetical protein